jgi:cell wall-associated NlpC family hydrolase
MQINGIAKIPSSTAQWPAAQPQATASSSSTAISTSSVEPPSSSIQIQNPARSAQVTTLAATDSTTVAGKNYSESIEESGGIYIASVPSPPGIRASGSSIVSAENNLDIKLDTLA